MDTKFKLFQINAPLLPPENIKKPLVDVTNLITGGPWFYSKIFENILKIIVRIGCSSAVVVQSGNIGLKWVNYIWDKVFQNGPSKICGRQPLENFTWSILEYFVPYSTHKWSEPGTEK